MIHLLSYIRHKKRQKIGCRDGALAFCNSEITWQPITWTLRELLFVSICGAQDSELRCFCTAPVNQTLVCSGHSIPAEATSLFKVSFLLEQWTMISGWVSKGKSSYCCCWISVFPSPLYLFVCEFVCLFDCFFLLLCYVFSVSFLYWVPHFLIFVFWEKKIHCSSLGCLLHSTL